MLFNKLILGNIYFRKLIYTKINLTVIFGIFLVLVSVATKESFAAKANLIFLSAPQGEVGVDSTVKLVVTNFPPTLQAPDTCGVFRSATSVGDSLSLHTTVLNSVSTLSKDKKSQTVSFKPSDLNKAGTAQLGLGFHYLMVGCSDGKFFTSEIPFWVSSKQSTTILTPLADEPSGSPNITWTPVPGVPAYHLLLSDQAINIDASKGTVSGASIIWQVITTKTSIAYGTPDPSGNFAKVAAPPLSPNVPYNLVILNNYDGRSALSTSSKAQGLKLFAIKPQAAPLSKPKNLAPSVGKILTSLQDSTVKFIWSAARAGTITANTYKLYVYALETQDKVDLLVPIWQTEVTDTTASMDARRTLLTKQYTWKVFALNDAGIGVVSDTSSFQYRNDVQTLKINARTVNSLGDTVGLSDVRIDIVPLDGSADALPLFTISGGQAEKVLATGGYQITLSKSGYLTQSRTINLNLTAIFRLDMLLPMASCRITGKVADGNNSDLDNVLVTATGGGKTSTTLSDASGGYLLGVAPGSYSLSFSKADFQSPADTIFTLAVGQGIELGKRILKRPTGSLNGTITNDKNQPLSNCQVIVKTGAGTVLRTLLSDDKGNFSGFFSSGNYVISVTKTGFSSEEKSITLTDAANVNFQLTSGASVIKGRISINSFPSLGQIQTSPLPGAMVDLASENGTVLRSLETDLRGEFSLSADTGIYMLRVSKADRARPDSLLIKILQLKSTVSGDLALQGFASIQGTVTLSPDTVVDPSLASISLLNAPSLKLFRSAKPQSYIDSANPTLKGQMSFSLDGIPDGKYRVTCGLPGFGLDSEPEFTIANSVWNRNLSLTLKKATQSLTFLINTNKVSIPGTIRLLTPQALEISTGKKITSASAGTYTLNASPDSINIIPINRFTFALSSKGAADTTVTLTLPYAHTPVNLKFQDQESGLELVIQNGQGGQNGQAAQNGLPIDSIVVFYGYGNPTEVAHFSSSEILRSGSNRILRIHPSLKGGLLTYYFVIYSGNLIFSNEDASRRFHAAVEPSHALASIRISAGDSLRLPSESRCDLLLHGYDAAGNRLDSAIDARGMVKWSANSKFPARIGKRPQRALPIETNSPSSLLPKSTLSSSPTLSKRTSFGPAPIIYGKDIPIRSWDTLYVSATLDSVTQTLAVPTQIVPAVINKLSITTSQGNILELPSPTTIGLFVTGFDTTITPPLTLVPNPKISILPAEAGSIQEMAIHLNPNFIGPLRIFAKQLNADGSEAVAEYHRANDSLQNGINIGQTLNQGDSAKTFFHDAFFELGLKDSILTAPSQAGLRLYKRAVSKTFSSGVNYAVIGNLFEISNPAGATFSSPPKLSLGIIPAMQNRKNQFKRFNTFKLDWFDPKDSAKTEVNGFKNSAQASTITDFDGNYYGLLSQSKSLTAGEVEIIPNPFSPLVMAIRDGNTDYGARIHLTPESDRSAEVTLSIRIYNSDGELIRHLVDHKTIPKAPVDFYWDGKVDGGRWARNGRYLVKISLGSTGTPEARQLVRSVVVFQ